MALPKEDGVSEDPRTPGDPSGTGYTKPYDPYEDYNGGSPPDVPLQDGYGWTWTGSRWEQTLGKGLGFVGGKTYNVVKGPDGKPDPYLDYNNGSPPNAPLDPGKTWKWSGSRWEQVAVGGPAPTPPSGPAGPVGAPVPTTPRPSTSGVAGVPQSYAAASSAAKSTIAGTVPTLADAVAQAKQYLPATPEISKPGPFTAPTPAWAEDRNRVVQAILKQPEVMGQSFQDALFEQQKEQQAQMAAQARARLSQTTAARGLSAAGGQELLGQAGVEEGFINNLLAARRDVSTKAAEANRASSLAAIEMANAVEQGDFARAQAAYETQLKANQIYDQLRLQAAELERSNVALAAQNLLAQREMQLGEQSQSFDQYLRQLQMNEMIRQFNEQLALSYGKFGWEQQIGLANLFPGS